MARIALFRDRYKRYTAPRTVAAYVKLARKHGLDPVEMALAFITSRPFVTVTIIGCTLLGQLDHNAASVNVRLTPALLESMDSIHAEKSNPAP